MHTLMQRAYFATLFIALFNFPNMFAQSASNSGTIYGTVTDASGAAVAGASVSIENPVSGYSRDARTDGTGHYQFTNLPFNAYHLSVTAKGFNVATQDVDIRSFVPIALTTGLKVGATITEVTVQAGDLIESDSTMHTDVDRGCSTSFLWRASLRR